MELEERTVSTRTTASWHMLIVKKKKTYCFKGYLGDKYYVLSIIDFPYLMYSRL